LYRFRYHYWYLRHHACINDNTSTEAPTEIPASGEGPPITDEPIDNVITVPVLRVDTTEPPQIIVNTTEQLELQGETVTRVSTSGRKERGGKEEKGKKSKQKKARPKPKPKAKKNGRRG
jgi:hypothetical protein